MSALALVRSLFAYQAWAMTNCWKSSRVSTRMFTARNGRP